MLPKKCRQGLPVYRPEWPSVLPLLTRLYAGSISQWRTSMKRIKGAARLLAIPLICFALTGAPITPAAPAAANPLQQTGDSRDWPYYGNDLGNMRYVDLDLINPGNVAQ